MELFEMIVWVALGFVPTLAIGQLICASYSGKSRTLAGLIKLKIKN